MELVVEIAGLASGFVVEIGVPASDVVLKEPAVDKVFVVGNSEVIGNLVERVDNSVSSKEQECYQPHKLW